VDYKILERIVWQEFSSYYLPEELPAQWSNSFLENELPEMARKSALRLNYSLKGYGSPILEDLLESACQDSAHPLIQVICDATLIDWAEETEKWDVLKKILSLIVRELKRLNSF
jgi:hypothetical protein